MRWFLASVLFASTAAFASTAGDIAQCKMKAEQMYPVPSMSNNGREQEDTMRTRGWVIQTCMEASGYHFIQLCEGNAANEFYVRDLQTCYSTYSEAKMTNTCLENVDHYYFITNKEEENCYQADSWWKKWIK